jgi:N4-gp56 family major capsid protein
MAVTAFATGDSMAEKVWATEWIDASIDRSFFKRNGLIGTNPESAPIWQRNDLKNKAGDTIYLGEMEELTNAGITGDNLMEGLEEEMLHYDDSVTIDQVRNAVRIEGAMTEQRTAQNLRSWSRRVLKNWMSNKIEYDCFTYLGTAGTRVLYGSGATATSDITSSSKLDATRISQCLVVAEEATPEIRPVTVDGMEVFVLLAAPEAMYDLRISDTTLFVASLQYAMERGLKNPIFRNGELYWNGVVIHKHRYVPVASNWGSTGALPGATNLFMGAHAGVIAFAKERIWKEKLFDYDNSPGVCVGTIWGFTKLVFNAEDSGLVTLRTYRTNVAETT